MLQEYLEKYISKFEGKPYAPPFSVYVWCELNEDFGLRELSRQEEKAFWKKMKEEPVLLNEAYKGVKRLSKWGIKKLRLASNAYFIFKIATRGESPYIYDDKISEDEINIRNWFLLYAQLCEEDHRKCRKKDMRFLNEIYGYLLYEKRLNEAISKELKKEAYIKFDNYEEFDIEQLRNALEKLDSMEQRYELDW